MDFFNNVRTEWRAVLICLIASIGAIQFGYDGSYFSGILVTKPFTRNYGHFDPAKGTYVVDPSVLSLVTSIINAGEFVGAVSAFWIGEKLGRRGGLFLSSACVCAGVILQVSGPHEGLLITGRLVLGFAVGVISCCVPLYCADCAPANLRGMLVNTYQFSIAIGLILGVIVDYATRNRLDSASYRIPMSVQFIFPIVLCLGMFFIAPESPRWLMYKDRTEDAARALRKILGEEAEANIPTELSIIQLSINEERSLHVKGSWRDLCKWGPEARKAYLGFALQAFQQGSGVNFIVGYGVIFFSTVGIKNPLLTSLGIYLVCIPAIWISSFLIEHYGRRPILILSGLLMASSSYIMGGLGLKSQLTYSDAQAVVTMVFLFMFFFNLCWGPCVWVVCSELATGRNRSKLMTVSTASNWFWNWLVGFTFPYLFSQGKDAVNLGPKIGFIYGSLMIAACIWVFFFLPETAQRSLEEIDEMFENHVPARQFSSYVCTRNAETVRKLEEHDRNIESRVEVSAAEKL